MFAVFIIENCSMNKLNEIGNCEIGFSCSEKVRFGGRFVTCCIVTVWWTRFGCFCFNYSYSISFYLSVNEMKSDNIW